MTNKNYSPVYRIMHWAIAICTILLLGTIFLRLTWLNKDHVSAIIQEFIVANELSLSQEQMTNLARQIRKPMWKWHIFLGYALTALFSIRMLLPIFGEMRLNNPLKKSNSKTRFQYWVYIIFYVCLSISLITGLVIEFGPKSIKDPFESVHVLSIYYLIAFLILHIGGVIMAEMTNQSGIVSSIISGRKVIKTNDD